MKTPPSVARSIMVATVFALLLVFLAAVGTGCASDSPATTSTTGTTGSSTSIGPTTTGGETTTTLPATISEYDRELAKTAKIQNRLESYLSERQVPEDDPRIALVLGLRARTQAITCRKALDQNDLDLADSAIKEVYSTINVARGIATGTVAQTLADAKTTIETVGAPSDRPGEAAASLDQFIAQLAPLLDEATAMISSTTST